MPPKTKYISAKKVAGNFSTPPGTTGISKKNGLPGLILEIEFPATKRRRRDAAAIETQLEIESPATKRRRDAAAAEIHKIEVEQESLFRKSYRRFLRANGLLKKGERVHLPEIFP